MAENLSRCQQCLLLNQIVRRALVLCGLEQHCNHPARFLVLRLGVR
jgi:hypothetical protein